MLKLISRVLVLNCLVMMILIALAMLWGHQFNRLPGFSVQISTPPNANEYHYIDVITGVHYAYTYQFNGLYTSHDSNVSFSSDWRNYQMLIYLHRANRWSPTLLGTYDVESANIPLAWSYDSRSLFMVDKAEHNEIELYEIDVATGQRTLYGIYPFKQIPMYLYMTDEQHLTIWRPGEFILLDVTTGDYFSGETSRTISQSFDDRYFMYGINAEFDAYMEQSSFYLLDTGNNDVHQIGTETIIPQDIFFWSPVESILPMTTENGDYLYYAETDYYQALPENYQIVQLSYPWSADGRFLFVKQNLDDGRTEYGYLDIESRNISHIHTAPERTYIDTYAFEYYLSWSPEQDMILVVPDRRSQNLIFTVYDASTLEILHHEDTPITPIRSNIYSSWAREFR